jgi:hypothetical protein
VTEFIDCQKSCHQESAHGFALRRKQTDHVEVRVLALRDKIGRCVVIGTMTACGTGDRIGDSEPAQSHFNLVKPILCSAKQAFFARSNSLCTVLFWPSSALALVNSPNAAP